MSDPASAVKRLLISCADRPGIVSAVSGFLFDAGANILRSDQYTTNPEGGDFFMRMEFHLPLGGAAREAFERDFVAAVAEPFEHGLAHVGHERSASAWRSWSRARSTACST